MVSVYLMLKQTMNVFCKLTTKEVSLALRTLDDISRGASAPASERERVTAVLQKDILQLMMHFNS